MTMEINNAAMNPKQESLMLAAICLFMLLLALGGLAYGVATGLILASDALFTLDGILLVLICLSILVTFGGLLLNVAMRSGWLRRKPAVKDEKPAGPAGPSA